MNSLVLRRNDLLDNFFDKFFENDFFNWNNKYSYSESFEIMKVKEQEDDLLIYVNVAGLKKDDIKLEISEKRVLTISYKGGRLEDEEISLKNSFTLPKYVDPESADANVDNGVLRITLKKAVKDKKLIEVK